ncbi:Glycine cleavage system H protein [Ectocarpus siliculosus]|uniref:Glycine cleavage system H protein n=1 Tax=Ectocarpus siliculosus TaxID=2880 RepID=D7G1U2_ECTSI|nr:Glycine cleavage system H protein [Ectocarpus siliculosus]|eukprot:CBJ48668.1 Glycine cleavage system H protein [Ectocarpus siliculosus]
MASVAVARFSGALRSGAAVRTMRAFTGPSPSLARTGWLAAGAGNKRCMSTVYAESHEYLTVEGDTAKVGITAFAAKALGDVVFVDLPEVGDELEAGDSFGSVESVKAASDVYSPASGEVLEVNEALTESPGILNEDPMGKGWFIKIKMTEPAPDTLMDPAAYETHCEDSA